MLCTASQLPNSAMSPPGSPCTTDTCPHIEVISTAYEDKLGACAFGWCGLAELACWEHVLVIINLRAQELAEEQWRLKSGARRTVVDDAGQPSPKVSKADGNDAAVPLSTPPSVAVVGSHVPHRRLRGTTKERPDAVGSAHAGSD